MDSLQLTNGNDKNTNGRENNYVEILFTEDRDHGIRVNHEMTEALYGYSFVDEDQQQEEKIASSAWCTRKAFTLVLLYLGVFLDAMDVVLLPTSFASLKETMHFSPTALGFSDFLTSIFAATLSLFWGYLADRHSRVKILSAIAVLWGVMSLLVSLSPNGTWFMILRGISGIFLGGLYPVKLSLISDLVGPSARGTAFGIFGVFVAFGQMSGALMVSSLDDWRLSFRITGTMCLVYAVVILSCASEPQRGEADKVEAKAQAETPQIRLRFLQASSVILTNSSVLLIFVAQVCGSGAKVSFHWLMFWLQYKGYSKVQAPLFMSLYEWGRVTGGILGGLAGDKLDKVNPQHGRISLGQVLQIVLMLLILSLFSPFSDVNGIALGSILFLIGMALDPPDSAASKPMLMSVVPPNHRGQAAGWEHVFVKAFGSLIGGPFNGYLAEISGFDTSDKSHSQNIFAVQNAILWTTVVPALISFCAFTLLHWVYPATINQSTVEKVPESDPEAPK